MSPKFLVVWVKESVNMKHNPLHQVLLFISLVFHRIKATYL